MTSRWWPFSPSARWGQAKSSTTKGAPGILAIDADAINKRFPGLESIDVPAGAFRGRPPTPDDTVTTLGITYRFVAPNTMLDGVAGAIARSIFKTKAQLVAKTPLASQIEAPDPDDKNPVLPVHPGVAAYLDRAPRWTPQSQEIRKRSAADRSPDRARRQGSYSASFRSQGLGEGA